ncbi:MAG TPA: PspC domain-containing protein [Solirubrobacteraceae bacterium]|nr:PspC domain-containing protein [Solirubrobacteraceae bacterium]
MTGSDEGQRPAARIVRARDGRLLGGVCAGLPDFWGLGTNGRRLMFVFATLLAGLGVVAYIACWLVIPAPDHDPDADPVRSVVLLAWATGALVALVLVASAAAIATVFGLGWVVFGLAAVVVGVSFGPLRTRIPTLAALLTLGALTLPAVAVALSPLRLAFQSGQTIQRPANFRTLGQTVYRSGFGTLLIDVRHTQIPTSGRTTLRIDAGLRRTIVALPSGECVRVRVNYDIHLFPGHFAALLSGRSETEYHDVDLFGTAYGYGALLGTRATAVAPGAGSDGPRLTIDFTSQGGGLYVRNYPNSVDPQVVPQWPGYRVIPEPRPDLAGEPKKVQNDMLATWHSRLKVEQANGQFVNSQMAGPCAT